MVGVLVMIVCCWFGDVLLLVESDWCFVVCWGIDFVFIDVNDEVVVCWLCVCLWLYDCECVVWLDVVVVLVCYGYFDVCCVDDCIV